MQLAKLWQDLEASPVGDFVASSSWAFPTIETVHVIAIVTVLGSIAVMDLRLLGVASKETAVTEIEKDTLRWTWGAFVLAAITGSLLFISKASNYAVNPFFLSKLVLIVLAGANMAAFHTLTWPSVKTWDSGPLPQAAKLAGGLSLGIWVVVVFVARAVGFTLDKFHAS
jgi:hypothetical protein